MSRKAGGFIWYELLTSDPDAAASFYGAVIGWTARPTGQPGMDYRQWSIGDENVGGLMAIPADAAAGGMRPAWLGYVDVPDVDAAVADVERAGGSVRMKASDIPGVGRIAMVADPRGAAFYVMAPTGEGQSTVFWPGRAGHGGWHELRTTDWRAALDFYGALLGWRESSTMDMGPMGTYLLFNAGGDAIGGMMNSPNAPPASWVFYFWVVDIDDARTRLEGAGGTVLSGPTEVPGGAWVVQAIDPQGAQFALVGPRRR